MKVLRGFIGACFICVSLFTTYTLSAQSGLALGPDSAWRVSGKQLFIDLTSVMNLRDSDTGPLVVSIYAKTDTPYDGGSPGKLIGRVPLGSLPAMSGIGATTVVGKAKAAGGGYKYTSLVLEEQSGRRFNIADYIPYYSTYAFVRQQGGGVGSEDGAIGHGGILASGASSLTVQGRKATFALEKIQSRRAVDTTGLLRVAVYATPEGAENGDASTLLAVRNLGQLAPGDYFSQVEGRLNLKKPRRGTYYLTLAVEEEQEAGFVPVATINLPDPQNF